MKSSALTAPGVVLGAYPERRVRGRHWSARVDARLTSLVSGVLGRSRPYRKFPGLVRALQPTVDHLDGSAAEERLRALRALLAHRGFEDALVAEAFAYVVRAATATLGLAPYDTQLMAARIMLDGRLAEMATGEGKTLAAAICAATGALAGIPVHVISVNDYLVARDAQSLRPLYAALGLTVGAITQPLPAADRQAAYSCDITYCTAKELAFDYLRDGVALGHDREDLVLRARQINGTRADRGTLLRGLCMGIVDEADSVLIDEARVPLILSQSISNGDQQEYHANALRIAGRLSLGRDYTLQRGRMTAELTDEGSEFVARLTEGLEHVWKNRLHREEAVATALAALHLYRRDRHYLVQEDKAFIIDEATGRIAAGRVWSRGLHQLIELKENCALSAEQVTTAQITFQRFFQRYLRLGGMSGTLAEARAELRAVYNLEVVGVPTWRPCQRTVLPTRLLADREAQFAAVIVRVQEIVRAGRPVLIGTDSVSDSETLSAGLSSAGIAHEVLNARQDAREAGIVARAGEPGAVTVATNMAGRGTDIPLGPGIAERGGLHVICCQQNTSRRIDRQLIGRCARKGDPGTAETWVALDKSMTTRFLPQWFRARVSPQGLARPTWLVTLILRLPQWLEEMRRRAERRELLKHDARVEQELTLGPME